MIQASKKLLLFFLFIYFCLFRSGVVYGTGVTIDFSNFSLGNIQVGTMSWGTTNNNNPSTQPTTPTLLTPTTVNTTTTNSIPTTNSNTSNMTNFTSSYQKFNSSSGQSPISSIDTHKLTKELTHQPVTFGSLPENEPLLPNAEHYIVTVCLSFNNIFASGCSDKATPAQASEKLAEILLNKYFKGNESRPFRIILPSIMPDQQKQLLHQIEIQAMTLVETRIFKSNGTFIKEYDKVAREEAERGVNWSHTLKDDKSIHDFYTKKAFTKLNNIATQEKNPSSKNFKKN